MLLNDICYFGDKVGVVHKRNLSDFLPMFIYSERKCSPLRYWIGPNDSLCLLPEFGLTGNVDVEGLEPSK